MCSLERVPDNALHPPHNYRMNLTKPRASLLDLFVFSVSFAIIGAVGTLSGLNYLVAHDHPIARHLGFHPNGVVMIDFSKIPGGYAERIGFVASTEPGPDLRCANSYPVVTGMVTATTSASLSELASIPPAFFNDRSQPIPTALSKMTMLNIISDRVLTKGEHPDKKSALALASLLDRAGSVAEDVRESVATEKAWSGVKSLGSGIEEATRVSRANALQAAAKLRAS